MPMKIRGSVWLTFFTPPTFVVPLGRSRSVLRAEQYFRMMRDNLLLVYVS